MASFGTSRGTIEVQSWGYQLQGAGGEPLDLADLVDAPYDLLVVEPTATGRAEDAFSPEEVAVLRDGPGGERVLAAYLSIGEASDFESYWDPAWTSNGKATGRDTVLAPDWLGPVNPEWPESRKVRYWDPDWQALLHDEAGTGAIDRIAAQGFDLAYLDIVDAYAYWPGRLPKGERVAGDPAAGDHREATARMIDLITDLTANARQQNPDFHVVPQNGAFIINDLLYGDGGDELPDPTRVAAFHDAIAGIAIEDLYFRGRKDEDNAFKPDKAQIAELKARFLALDEPVLVVEYLTRPKKIIQFLAAAEQDGFIAHVAPSRELDRLGLATAEP